jgi:cold shock protein
VTTSDIPSGSPRSPWRTVGPLIAAVREWRDEEGWGILAADETPGGIFIHFSNIQVDGPKSLTPGEQVEVEAVGPYGPELEVEGCRYAASVARPLR